MGTYLLFYDKQKWPNMRLCWYYFFKFIFIIIYNKYTLGMEYCLRVVWFYFLDLYRERSMLFHRCTHKTIKTMVHQKHNAVKYNFIDSLTCFWYCCDRRVLGSSLELVGVPYYNYCGLLVYCVWQFRGRTYTQCINSDFSFSKRGSKRKRGPICICAA